MHIRVEGEDDVMALRSLTMTRGWILVEMAIRKKMAHIISLLTSGDLDGQTYASLCGQFQSLKGVVQSVYRSADLAIPELPGEEKT